MVSEMQVRYSFFWALPAASSMALARATSQEVAARPTQLGHKLVTNVLARVGSSRNQTDGSDGKTAGRRPRAGADVRR